MVSAVLHRMHVENPNQSSQDAKVFIVTHVASKILSQIKNITLYVIYLPIKAAYCLKSNLIYLFYAMIYKRPVACSLEVLERNQLLTTQNKESVTNHQQPDMARWGLQLLEEASLLTQSNIEVFLKHPKPCDVEEALDYLHKGHLLNQKNFEKVLAHDDISSLEMTIDTLYYAEILTQQSFDKTLAHDHVGELERCMLILSDAKLLSEQNFELLINHKHLESLHSVISRLKTFGKNSSSLIAQVLKYDEVNRLKDVLDVLLSQNLLTSKNVKKLLLAPILLSDDVYSQLWVDLPRHLINAETLESISHICERPDPKELLLHFIKQLKKPKVASKEKRPEAIQIGAIGFAGDHFTGSVNLSNPVDMDEALQRFSQLRAQSAEGALSPEEFYMMMQIYIYQMQQMAQRR